MCPALNARETEGLGRPLELRVCIMGAWVRCFSSSDATHIIRHGEKKLDAGHIFKISNKKNLKMHNSLFVFETLI